MMNHQWDDFQKSVFTILEKESVLTQQEKIRFYSTGIRVGSGDASAVIFPKTLLQLWQTLEICISFNKVIIMQAANTGLTGGSTPDGDNYDRDIVIINTLKLDQLVLLNNGSQIIAFPGSTFLNASMISLAIIFAFSGSSLQLYKLDNLELKSNIVPNNSRNY